MLTINSVEITSANLEGGNSDTRYFGDNLTQLVPNKAGYALIGSKAQRNVLKSYAVSGSHDLTYIPKITNIVNPGNNTNLFNTLTNTYTAYSGFSSSKYVKTTNNFAPGNNSWTVEMCFITGSNIQSENTIISLDTTHSFSLCIRDSKLCYYLSDTGNSWTVSAVPGNTTITTNKMYYTKYVYDYDEQNFSAYVKNSYFENWQLDYQTDIAIYSANNRQIKFGDARGGGGNFTGKIFLEPIKITIGNTTFFDGSTAVSVTDYTVVGSPTISTQTISESCCTPFSFSFKLNSSSFTEGTKYLLQHPGLIEVKTEDDKAYFKFPWKDNKWYYLPNNILIEGENTISLIASDSQGGTTTANQIKLNVNNHNFTLTDSTMPLITTGVLGYREDLVI